MLKRLLPALALISGSLSLSAATVVADTATRLSSTQPVGFDVYLPLQHTDDLRRLLEDLHTAGSPSYHKWLTPEQFHARFAPSASSVTAVQQELSSLGLTVTAASAQHLHVTGSGTAVERAFSTTLASRPTVTGKTHISATTPLTLTPTLSSLGAVVVGLSGKVRMHAHSVRQAAPANRYSTAGPYWFTDLKQAYSWPSYQTYTGKGANIAILITGDYLPSDMTSYFAHEKLATPTYKEVKVLGGAPFDPNGGSFETTLDLQQSGGMAPNATITLYNIPDLTDLSIIAGLATIVNDNTADVVSMSFGGPELGYTAAYNDGVDYTAILRAEDDLMAQGNAQGITFIASSGDSGALSVPPIACFTNADPKAPCGSFQASAEFPASSPHVTGVGGTNLATTHSTTNLNSRYLYEQAYADPLAEDIFYGTAATGGFWGSGGGDSIIFKKPLFQTLVKTGNAKFRTVPDLSLHMGGCPGGTLYCNPDDSADLELLDGHLYGVIGTSASAPDFAGLTALNVERFGTRLGNENYYIYGLAAAQTIGLPVNVFRTDIPGYNGLYSTATTGTHYNRVLGNGTLKGRDFLLAPLLPVAGTPQTPSNP